MTQPDPTPDGRQALLAFLTTHDGDAGCGPTREVLDLYAEEILAGLDPAVRFPGVAIHLRDCHPCADDLAGLLALA
ncbi:hypothetical protein AB0I55_19800 [Actinocatenispora sera]|jgi:hypothetical protein|uniref:Zf-HC2 domain-containing protein n=1 Tax=Actinocatenispora sera TaxID=390989 RepID=A0A810L0Z7_9ACTN|nr:hypothetical protein [Actinocatenispora sera]BCJ28499.1 hypothetical protein Asera_26070 [Actinocatenispora sera]